MPNPFPVAVRSLQCADHAANIPPRVLSVHWNITKRCNFDCSYCSPHVHDAVSPFLDMDQAMSFVHDIDQRCAKKKQEIKWVFTGGEPFVDPSFLDLAQHIRSLATTHQINAITNGSVSAGIYSRAAEIFDGITVSLHLERSRQEIQHTLDKLPVIASKCQLSVNVMCVPGNLAQVQSIVDWLRAHGIAFVVRKLMPGDYDLFLPFAHKDVSRKHSVLLNIKDQISNRIQSKMHNDAVRSDRWKDLYDPEELEYLETINTHHDWANCGVWYSDGSYHEHNSDYLFSRSLVQFTGWTCWAGVDGLFVDFDGSVYRALCLNDGSLGHIATGVDFMDEPTICQRQWCVCNTDISTRKASQLGMLHVEVNR